MDITYLLWLQEWRITTHDALTPFLEGLSLVAVFYLVFLPTFIYWCVSKRKGLFILGAMYICQAWTVIIKSTACVYRPWVKDPRIIPAGNAIHTATGYSFPSGHSTFAATMYGGAAVCFWNERRMRWFAVLCIAAALLTGFSRNYLGVHTPQDVFVGLGLGVVALWFQWKLMAYLDKHPEKENLFLVTGILFAVVALIYTTFKSYPQDYVNGKLLVSPQKMITDGFKDYSALIAFCVARFIDKKWLHFESTGCTLKGVLVSLTGLIPLYFLIAYLKKPLVTLMGPNGGVATWACVTVFYIMLLYPLVLKWVCPPKAK